MADFSPTRFGFAQTINQRRQLSLSKEQLEDRKREQDRTHLAEQIESSRTRAVEIRDQGLELINTAIVEGNASAEQIAPLREQALVGATSHDTLEAVLRAEAIAAGASEEQLALLPRPGSFLQQQQQAVDNAIEIASLVQQANQESREPVATLTPEEAQQMGFPESAIVQQDQEGNLKLVFDPTENPSVLEERVALLTESGVGLPMAQGIAASRFAISVNPITNERQVIDIATGDRVGGAAPIGPDGATDVGMVPANLDTASATGLPGMLRNLSNIIVGAFNADLPFEESQTATDALKSIQEFTGITLQAEVPGRPSNFLQQRLRELTVTPNAITQGRERARSRLEQTQRLIGGEIARIENEVLPQELQPAIRVDTNLNLSRLKRLDEAYTQLISGLGLPTGGDEDQARLIRESREAFDAGNTEEARRLLDEAQGLSNGGN